MYSKIFNPITLQKMFNILCITQNYDLLYTYCRLPATNFKIFTIIVTFIPIFHKPLMTYYLCQFQNSYRIVQKCNSSAWWLLVNPDPVKLLPVHSVFKSIFNNNGSLGTVFHCSFLSSYDTLTVLPQNSLALAYSN